MSSPHDIHNLTAVAWRTKAAAAVVRAADAFFAARLVAAEGN
jgi:hypothetical protein